MSYELIFKSTERSDLDSILFFHVNQFNEIFIEIKDPTSNNPINFHYICLEKNSAIKLAKELRKQISFLED